MVQCWLPVTDMTGILLHKMLHFPIFISIQNRETIEFIPFLSHYCQSSHCLCVVIVNTLSSRTCQWNVKVTLTTNSDESRKSQSLGNRRTSRTQYIVEHLLHLLKEVSITFTV